MLKKAMILPLLVIIEFYEDSCYVKLPAYDRKMESIKEKYLGRKVIIT